MLLQNLDINSESNMSSFNTDFDSKSHAFEADSKTQSNRSFSPLLGPFSNPTDNRTIPALPNLTAVSSSWSSNSGTNSSLFSYPLSNATLLDKTPHKPFMQTQPRSHSPNVNLNVQQHNKSFPPGPGGLPNPHMHSMPLIENMDPLDRLIGVFPCVHIRGLHYDVSREDIFCFFHGLAILDIVLVPNSYRDDIGGEGFVLFATLADLQGAMFRNRQILNNRYVDIGQGRRSDYYRAVASQFSTHRGNEKGRGEGSPELLHGNHWIVGDHATSNQGMPVRTPLIQEASPIASKPSGGQHQQHGYTKGSSSGIKPGRGSNESYRPKGTGRGSGRGGGIQVGEHTGFLRMRGLPFTAAKDDIFDFFKQYEPVQDSVCLTYRSDGRATGEGYIAFTNPDNAKDAMALHRNTMGSRYIELFISNKEEHGRAHSRENSLR